MSMSDWGGVARLQLGFGLFRLLRTSLETHTHHPHATHLDALCPCRLVEHSLVSRFLTVASLVSCLSCFVSALLLSFVGPVLFVSFLCASQCLYLCLCL